MRRLVLVGLAATLAGCAMPGGAERPRCPDPDDERATMIVEPGGNGEARGVELICWRPDGDERLELWFRLPAGSACWRLDRLELIESAEAVSIALTASERTDPAGRACPSGDREARTFVDLQAPLAERAVLDGSAGE